MNLLKKIKNEHFGFIFFTLTMLLFYLFFMKHLTKMPFIQSDELEYIDESILIFNNFLTVHFTHRPCFSLFSLICIKFFKLNFIYPVLLCLNVLIYHTIFLGSFYYIFKKLNLPKLTFFCAASIAYTMPGFFVLSSCLLGDMPVMSWILLTLAGLISLYDSKYRRLKTFLLGIILALGFQTKPVFLTTAFLFTAVFLSLNLVRHLLLKKEVKSYCKYILPFLAGFLPTLIMIFPFQIQELIKELYYLNNVVDYWQSFDSVFNNLLWFPAVSFNSIFFVSAAVLVFCILSQLIKWTKVNLKQNSSSFKEFLLKITENKTSLIIISFTLMLFYISFFVNSKGDRVFFFLFQLFIIMGMIALNSEFHKKPQFASNIMLGIIIYNFLSLLSWTSVNPIPLLSRTFDLQKLSFNCSKPYVIGGYTYKTTGMLDAIKQIDEYNTDHENSSSILVFIPHNSEQYNNTANVAVARFSRDLAGFVPQIKDLLNAKYYFISANYNHGCSFGEGGIPRTFFLANYIILVKNQYKGSFFGNAELYNRLIVNKLSNEDPLFLDGLTPIYKKTNQLNDEIIIYKRYKLPSPQNFVEMVKIFAKEDEFNMWNVPFIKLALEFEPNNSDLQNQLNEMSKDSFLNSVKYDYGKPDREAFINSILLNKNRSTKDFNLYYPDFLMN